MSGRRQLSVVLFLVVLILVTASVCLAQGASTVVVLDVRGVIDPVVARYVQRGIAVANDQGAQLVIVQLDTPGGLDSAMRVIVQTILNSRVPVVVYVAPSGARAASAGVFITMAGHLAAMAPGTSIGAAHPVSLTQGGELPQTMQDKVTNDAAAYVQAIAQQRGRNAEWAEAAVRQSASLTATEAVQERVVDVVATDRADLLQKLNGRQIETESGLVTLHLEAPMVRPFGMTLLEKIAHGIVDPNIAYLLMTLGTIAIISELYHPGAILPGVTGVICLILAFVALGSLPVNWGGIALIVVAFVFFVLDIQVAGFALTVAGVVAFVIGSLLLFSPFRPPSPAMPRVSVSPWLLGTVTAIIVGFSTVALTAAVRAQRRAALLGPEVVIGKTGVAVTDIDPQGVVQLESETWTATAQEAIRAGEQVEVVESDGLRLLVRRVRQ